MTLESKNCKACRPKRKPVAKLSAKEIHNRVQTGDMNALMAKHLRIQQEQAEHNKQSLSSRKRWLKVWKAELREAIKPITREIISARNAHLYARRKGYGGKDKFYFEYMGLLMHEKTHAEMSHMLKPSRPPSSRWADYISPAVFTRVKEMWAGLPPIYKAGKIPLLITYRPDGAQLADKLSATTEGERR
jgi:hypothetical protein